ncbi:MAG TPA: DJ-1/PfpI family protein [Coriobacteriia bacterium]|nr:DJ-1/PfpI family protein [Coriobacteriia bacterium]
MTDVVMVIAPQIFRDEEYAEPKAVLEARGACITTASTAPGKCIGKLGMVAEAEVSVAEAAKRDWDAVVFVGGAGASVFFDDASAHALAHRVHESAGIVAAICIAPSTLAHAGLLDGICATAFPTQREDLIAHGAQWLEDPVAVSAPFITANGPEAATDFGEQVADALGLPEL